MAARPTNMRRRGGSWVVYLRVRGRQVQKSVADVDYGGEKPARSAAELFLANAKAQQIRGEFRQPARIRFDAFAAEWLADYARAHVRAKTFEGYEGVLRVHVVPHFGHLLLTEITRKAIDAFVADWSSGGPAFRERLRQARELEAARAREQDRDPRPVRDDRERARPAARDARPRRRVRLPEREPGDRCPSAARREPSRRDAGA
jgi:hypothetical protein